ncbi:hypothetical protein [Mesobacillus zeae]|uniref:hypothetical protein n=1 Tax=Mesobacillus zeae TaxID=1917180 RepID=UPI003007F76E
MKYKILTPNEQYEGVTEGIPFAAGVGYTDDKNVKDSLVNNYGYKCEEKAEEKPKKGAKSSGK